MKDRQDYGLLVLPTIGIAIVAVMLALSLQRCDLTKERKDYERHQCQ